MAINEGNQGDWQKLDPRVADVVRAQEEQMLATIMGATAAEVNGLFNNTMNAATVTGRILTQLNASTGGIDLPVQEELRRNLELGLDTAKAQERVAPDASAAERVQRRTREFASAVRKAIPADIIDRVDNNLDLPVGPHATTPIVIGTVNAPLDIDISHEFWLNRIQDRAELIASLTGVAIGEIGVTHGTTPPTQVLSAAAAEHIADSNVAGNDFWNVLLRHNTKTRLSDEQVSSLNVNEAVELVMNNDQVRRSIAPPDTSALETEMNHLVEEKNVVSAIDRLQSLDIPDLDKFSDWQKLRKGKKGIKGVDKDISTLAAATPSTPIDMPSIGVSSFTLDPNPSTRISQIASFNAQLRDKKRELEDIDEKMQRYSSVLVSAIENIRNVRNRKAPSAGLHALDMITAGGVVPDRNEFTKARTPAVVANELRTVLALRASPTEYDADIESRRVSIANAGDNPDNLIGREAVLKVFDVHNRQVQRLDARRSEEATQTRYARNEMNKEEHDAREEAVEELTGRDQRRSERIGNRWHELGHGRPQDIICKLAESNTIGASTEGTRRGILLGRRKNNATPKWTELSYPRLITAYAALRKLNEDSGSPIHLRNTGYFKTQMATVSNLLATRYAEQVERDFAREPESEEQRQDRKGQGERNRKQRLIRLLVNNPLPSEYSARADSAIEEAASRSNRVRRATSATVAATWGFTKNRAKNVFLGEGSKLNPTTYPARGVKAFWKFGTTPLGS